MIIRYHIKIKLNKIPSHLPYFGTFYILIYPILKYYFFNPEELVTLEENVKTTLMNVRNLQTSAEITPLVQIPLGPFDALVTQAT